MPKGNAVSVYMRNKISDELNLRGENRSDIVNRDLERLYNMYDRTLKTLDITSEEARFLVDIANGTINTADSAAMLWAEVEDACIYDQLHEKWQVDKDSFINKIKNLKPFENLALVDAAERCWEEHSNKNENDMNEIIDKIFIIKG